MAMIWAFLLYWLVIFVGCYVVVEVAQDQLYDEVTPHVGLKVTAGSFLLALMLTVFYARGAAASFIGMFGTNFIWTVFQAIVWFGVFALIFQFQPWHAFGLSVLTMLLVQGLATMGVDSFMTPTPATVNQPAGRVNKPVRQTLSPPPAPAQPKEAAKAQ